MELETPTINDITPNKGPETGGNNVTIKGSNFKKDTSVNFGTAPGNNLKVLSDQEITVTAPTGKGNIDVIAITSNNKSNAIIYTYQPIIWRKIWDLINTNIVAGLLIFLITDFIRSVTSNQKYTDYYHSNPIHALLIFLGIIFIIVIIKKLVNLLMKKIPVIKPINPIKDVITFVALILICLFIIFPLLIQPTFEITEPQNGSHVEYRSTVSGIGAIPGSQINIYIVDKYGQIWKVGNATLIGNNFWKCDGANIGQYGNQYAGQSFTLFAILTKDGKSYETPHINVIRS